MVWLPRSVRSNSFIHLKVLNLWMIVVTFICKTFNFTMLYISSPFFVSSYCRSFTRFLPMSDGQTERPFCRSCIRDETLLKYIVDYPSTVCSLAFAFQCLAMFEN